MGTNFPNSGYKCHIKGNLLLTTYPSTPFIEFQFKVGNGLPGAEIGTTIDKIAFRSTWTSYNKLYAEKFFKMSDENFKINLTSIETPIKKLLELKPYKYDFIDRYINENGDSVQGTLPEYGFISQEVEKVLTEIKITEDVKDCKLMDYDQIIPLLVAGIQEQQKQINSLEAQIARLIAKTSSPIQENYGDENNSNDVSKLFSNAPNPFNITTSISYYLCNNSSSAQIKVWDMSGNEKKIFNLNSQQGNNHVIINYSDLYISGTYVYALIIDGQIIDAKTLIFIK